MDAPHGPDPSASEIEEMLRSAEAFAQRWLAPLVVALFWFRLPDVFGPMPNWFGLLAIIGVGVWSLLALKHFEHMKTCT